MKENDAMRRFRLDGRVAVVTGGGGLLGGRQARAIAQAGGIPVLWDIDGGRAARAARCVADETGVPAAGRRVDITSGASIRAGLRALLDRFGRLDILVNNAANDPKVAAGADMSWSRLENFDPRMWERDLAVGLTGAFLCAQALGSHMAGHKGGVILNVASDLGVIAPDQRIYRRPGLPRERQPAKPVTYSVIKHGLIGLTKYLATYWADAGVRVNAISPGGVYTSQPPAFVKKLSSLIPMGRMASLEEYDAAFVFLLSDASSYMTGANLIIDGGRTCW